MELLTFIKDYKNNKQYRESFNELATSTFGITFEPWFKKGFWNDRYICYSYLTGDKIVANVSISKMTMLIKGEPKTSIQIGTVMTHPDYRKRGLAGSLIEKVIAEYEHGAEIFYLFASDEISGFYEKYGFKQYKENLYSVALENKLEKPKQNLKKLDLEKDKQFILEVYTHKNHSNQFDVENGEHVLGFYGTYAYGDCIYYIEKLRTIVIFSIKEDTLHLYSVINQQEHSFDELMNYTATEAIKQVIFYFTPDYQDIKPKIEKWKNNDDIFHIRTSTVTITGPFKFPIIAHA